MYCSSYTEELKTVAAAHVSLNVKLRMYVGVSITSITVCVCVNFCSLLSSCFLLAITLVSRFLSCKCVCVCVKSQLLSHKMWKQG